LFFLLNYYQPLWKPWNLPWFLPFSSGVHPGWAKLQTPLAQVLHDRRGTGEAGDSNHPTNWGFQWKNNGGIMRIVVVSMGISWYFNGYIMGI
jgi:hypothetical protein